MIIKKLQYDELYSMLPLVWRVFCKYEAVNCPEDGKQAFYDAVHSEDYLTQLTAYGAFVDGSPVGIIATRNQGSHIALFFVEGKYHGRGIGRKLWNSVLAENDAEEITVNSSQYAVEIYRKLGFEQTASAQTEDGIIFIPMKYTRTGDTRS